MKEEEIKIQQERAYIKIYKNSKNYTWELKAFEDTDINTLLKLKEELNKLNNELLNTFVAE